MLDIKNVKLGPGYRLRDISNEILSEFYRYGRLRSKTAMAVDAERWLRQQGLDESESSRLLQALRTPSNSHRQTDLPSSPTYVDGDCRP